MNRRAREVLTSIAAAGIGGAIGTLVGRRPRRRARPREAVPDVDLEGMQTSPTYEELEIVIVDGELITDDEDMLDLATAGPVVTDDAGLDAQPERDGDGQVGAAADGDEHVPAGDDRGDGENWIEDMLEDTSSDLPAERPLVIQADMDQKLTSLDDTRPRRRH